MRRLVLAVVLVAIVFAGCGRQASRDGSKVQVVASFYPLAEAAARVGGDAVEVTNLTPAGTEPHDLELSPRQVDQLEDADLVLYLGQGFQPAVQAVAERRSGPSLDLLATLPPGDGEVDPHFWLDPVLMVRTIDQISKALAGVEGTDERQLDANAAAYREEVRALDLEFGAGLRMCQRRLIVTSHAAFGHLARRYQLIQRPIAGLSPGSEPDPRRLAELTDLIGREGVTTVFYEALVSPAVAETLAQEAQVQAAVLDPLEGLSQEAIGAGQDYASVMRDNLAALRGALGCE